MSTGTTIMNVVKADMVGMLDVNTIHEILSVVYQNMDAANSVMGADDVINLMGRV